ncbi:Hypothetical predicted protein [Cloeon dipterum]|uniref:Uncharacterized protein n=1 Tax=Cloeon dipterum TaxID=197152 RepID=A0A8S1E8R1_9INSE|nr:Hypothetical predicted protein [Cloeon dipterum]
MSEPLVMAYKYESHRLYSLLKKNDWQHVNPFALARSGFYYLGKGDHVQCTFCNLEVSEWQEGDNPDVEHAKYNDKCPFLRDPLGAGDIAIGSEQIEMAHDGLGKTNPGATIYNPEDETDHGDQKTTIDQQ